MTSAAQSRPLLTVPEVADLLRVSARTVRRRIDAGDLPAYRLGSGPQPPVRIDQGELEAWITRHRKEPDDGNL